MKKKTKPGAIQQLLSYAGNNKKQLYLSTFLATLGELFGMAPFITVSLLVAETGDSLRKNPRGSLRQGNGGS